MNILLNHFSDKLHQIQLLPRTNCLLTCSGGQDSMTLFFFFLNLQNQWGFNMHGLYCHHFWQRESFQTSFHLTKVFSIMETPLTFSLCCISLKNENTARHWRYSIFERFSFVIQSLQMITGQTSSDQIESFFLNLTRGTSMNGIATLYWKRSNYSCQFRCFNSRKSTPFFLSQDRLFFLKKNRIKLVCPMMVYKPFLKFTRFEIYHFVCLQKLPTWTDPTNFKMQYLRNRIRYQLLPTFRFYFHNKIDICLLRFIENLMQDKIFLKKLTRQLNPLGYQNFPTFLVYDSNVFNGLPHLFKRKLLFDTFICLKSKSSHFSFIEETIRFLFLFKKKTIPFCFVLKKNLIICMIGHKYIFVNPLSFGPDGI